MGGGGNPDNQAGYTSYDGNGNPAATQGGASLAFDAANKATLVGGNQVLSSYGPDGLRTQKTGSTGARFFNYDGLAPVVETGSGSGILAVNTFGPAGLISRNSGGVSTFYTPDERGNVAQRLSSTGAVQSSDLYNAYGKRLSGGGASGDPYGFGGQAGYYTDSETGLSLLGQRFYDPSVSRFLTRDPFGYPGGLNLYRYGGNNPVMNLDPSGMFSARDASNWYMGGMGGFSGWVDRNFMGGSTANFGKVTGEYDSGCASGWQVAGAGAGAWFGANLAMNAIPGGGEAHAAEVVGEDGLRMAAEDIGKGCLRCFVASTPVQMADGSTKPIQQVQVGDQVLSRDLATGKDEAKTVTFTIERHAPSVVDVVLHDAKTGKAETLTCTPEHPLFVQGQGWVEAGSLGIGTSIISRAGPALEVTGLTWQKNKAEDLAAGSAGSSFGGYTVYNLTVEDDHTFFVGTSGGGTWVHNVNCGKTFDEARREAFEKAGMSDPKDVKFSKVDPETGTVVEFKGPDGAKVAYDSPHVDPGLFHDVPHIGWQTGGKRGFGGRGRGNIPYDGPQHPFRYPVKGVGNL